MVFGLASALAVLRSYAGQPLFCAMIESFLVVAGGVLCKKRVGVGMRLGKRGGQKGVGKGVGQKTELAMSICESADGNKDAPGNGTFGAGQGEENAVVAVKPVQALPRPTDENASRTLAFRQPQRVPSSRGVPPSENRTNSHHDYDELIQVFRERRTAEVDQVTSRLLPPAPHHPVFLLLGDRSTATASLTYGRHGREGRDQEVKHFLPSPLRSVIPPVCLAPAGHSLVLYGGVPEKDVLVPSAEAMCPVPVREERAGELYAVAVADGRREEVPVQTADWITVMGFLYVALLVLVWSTAVAVRRRATEMERKASKAAAAAERRAFEVGHAAGMMARGREQDSLRKERDQLLAERQNLVVCNAYLKNGYRTLERAVDGRQRANVAELAGARLAAQTFATKLAEARTSEEVKEAQCAQLSRRNVALERDHASLTDCNAQLVNACDELGKGVQVQRELAQAAMKEAESRARAQGFARGRVSAICEVRGQGSETPDATYMTRTLRDATNESMRRLCRGDLPHTIGWQTDGRFGKLGMIRLGRDKHFKVAVKAIPRTDDDKELLIDWEIKALKTVQGHPFIVQYLGHVKVNDMACIFMPAAAGNMSVLPKVDVESFKASRCAVQLISAVNHLVRNNMVHRNVQPDNVLVSNDGNLLLTDFGLAAVLTHEMPALSDMAGTSGCMAPEILQSHSYGYPVDMWGVGLVVFHMLHGKSPFWPGGKYKPANKVWSHEEARNVLEGKFITPLADSVKKTTCGDLIIQMLHPNPTKRLTAAQALEHPWVSRCAPLVRRQVERALREHARATDDEILARVRHLSHDACR